MKTFGLKSDFREHRFLNRKEATRKALEISKRVGQRPTIFSIAPRVGDAKFFSVLEPRGLGSSKLLRRTKKFKVY